MRHVGWRLKELLRAAATFSQGDFVPSQTAQL